MVLGLPVVCCGKRFGRWAGADEVGEFGLQASEYGIQGHSGVRVLGAGNLTSVFQ
jgi:hypothetical protein